MKFEEYLNELNIVVARDRKTFESNIRSAVGDDVVDQVVKAMVSRANSNRINEIYAVANQSLDEIKQIQQSI